MAGQICFERDINLLKGQLEVWNDENFKKGD